MQCQQSMENASQLMSDDSRQHFVNDSFLYETQRDDHLQPME